ncbi:HU family DNA-binding protein [Spiroplasma endosymbiont of Polydrusus formosus]|uniref:HU family DNA-binding protein n=1 Tax=Spiroplasma endosymbiont of Polydrusus formosus TaxID=3139326 RepID=UPI0035B53E6E
MSKKELAAQIAGEFTDLSKSRAEEITNFIFDKIKETLIKEDEVSIAGFGKFVVNKRATRDGRNPATGETIKISASKSAKFKPAKQLKDALKLINN